MSDQPPLAAWQQARRDRPDVVADLEAGVVAGGHPRLNGALGRLLYQDDGSGVQCHLCGLFYRNLAQHVRRRHQMAPDDYRDLVGLNCHTSLAAPVLQASLAAQARALEIHRRFTPRAGRGGAPMPATRLESRLREAQKARAQELVEVACPRCGSQVMVPKRRTTRTTYCLTCRPQRRRETAQRWDQQRHRSRRGVALPRILVDGQEKVADSCAGCGEGIMVSPVRSYRTNYCSVCRQERKRETGRLANRRYRERLRW